MFVNREYSIANINNLALGCSKTKIKKMKNILIKIIVFTTLLMANSYAQTNDIADIMRQKNKAEVFKKYQQALAAYTNNSDVLVLPGLIANKKNRILHLFAEATGLTTGETAEFFLIAEKSGHDYEALAVSFAAPGDIRKALVFLGMIPGSPADYTRWRFWSKGERVTMQFKPVTGKSPYVAAEDLVENTDTGKTLPVEGFIFTGSREVTSKTNSAVKEIAADVFDPMSIAANYNEIDSIFDIPRIARQSEVYTTQVISKKYHFTPGQLLDVIIKPERAIDNPRVYNLYLNVIHSTNVNSHAEYQLSDNTSNIMHNVSFADILIKFRQYIQKGRDPYMTVSFANNMPLSEVQKTCSMLAAVDAENGIRIDAPPKGQLYYKSFVPEDRLRDRKNRLPLKWELHIKLRDGKPEYTLINIDPQWLDNSDKPEIKTAEYKIKNSDELLARLKTKDTGIPVMIVFAQPAVTYEQLIKIIYPIMGRYNAVHVFLPVIRSR